MTTICKMLRISTSHLPEEIGSAGLSALEGVVADSIEYGWLMWVPENPEEHNADYDDVPEVVTAVQRYARANECDYVVFDADADQVDDLPTWDW